MKPWWAASRKHSSLRKESPAEVILFTFVCDETASGTARSNTENGLHNWFAPHFCMGQDCLWDSKEQKKRMDWTADLLFVYVWAKPASGTERIDLTADLLLHFLWDKTASVDMDRRNYIAKMVLLTVSEAVLSQNEKRSRSDVQSILCVAPLCYRGSVIP